MAQYQITYNLETVDNPIPFARYAHRARVARSLLLVEQNLPKNGTFVDFGAGTGLLLHKLRQNNKTADLIGIEPCMASSYPEAGRFVRNLMDVGAAQADLISAFEVCDNMPDHEIVEFLDHCQTVLRPHGKLLISVPVMYGLAVAPKILAKVILHGKNETGYDFQKMARSLFGLRIPRLDYRKHPRAGFDFRWLLGVIRENFEVERLTYSPFSVLPWFFNSQVFILCSPKTRAK